MSTSKFYDLQRKIIILKRLEILNKGYLPEKEGLKIALSPSESSDELDLFTEDERSHILDFSDYDDGLGNIYVLTLGRTGLFSKFELDVMHAYHTTGMIEELFTNLLEYSTTVPSLKKTKPGRAIGLS